MAAETTRFLDLAVRFLRATVTNQLARVAPRLYVQWTGQTGRGPSDAETSGDITGYFVECFRDYFRTLGIAESEISQWLKDKVLLEYGPGDLPGVAILMIAHGAKKVYCVDRFPLLSMSEKNIDAVEALLETLGCKERARAGACFRDHGRPGSGFATDRIEYLIRDGGLSGLEEKVDVVISRAVLEHVNDVEATFVDMSKALRPSGLAVHQVDLRSHGLHCDNPLDFLAWPGWMWTCMYSNKGSPNRWRVNHYRNVLAASDLEVDTLEPTLRADERDIRRVRPRLAKPFRSLSDDELSWLGFWLVCRKRPRPDVPGSTLALQA